VCQDWLIAAFIVMLAALDTRHLFCSRFSLDVLARLRGRRTRAP
jgi:hypothetical protein